MRAALVMLVAVGCSSSASAKEPMAWKAPKTGPFTIPAEWTTCAKDAECTVASMGCCDETPVNRAHYAELKKAFEDAGRRYCPPKDACGPGIHGTWDGEPGKCTAKVCAMPVWPK